MFDMKAYHRKYYRKNRETREVYNREYYRKNRETIIATNKEWRRRNHEKMKAYHREYSRKDRLRRSLDRHGITKEQWDRMYEKQGGLCAICGARPNGRRLSIDRCRRTAKVRGLLCSACILMIGNSRDRPELMHKAAAYLTRT